MLGYCPASSCGYLMLGYCPADSYSYTFTRRHPLSVSHTIYIAFSTTTADAKRHLMHIWNKETRELRDLTTTTNRLQLPPPPPPHGTGEEERDHGEREERDGAGERESSTARVFGLREFSAELRFSF
ncbi:hypothetical protein F2Q70_00002988 [Brassica cretica]|uniref:Uncharacterized protein n=1 Tax=Brassica cretica TaxID=69181 RepID=A0A8S9ILL4_BRACR|nr:hypothetical protein F2Q70_00002988 [Brassica cretica]